MNNKTESAKVDLLPNGALSKDSNGLVPGRRINRVADNVGEEEVAGIVDEVYTEFGRRQDEGRSILPLAHGEPADR